jgi:hypothetical protein
MLAIAGEFACVAALKSHQLEKLEEPALVQLVPFKRRYAR